MLRFYGLLWSVYALAAITMLLTGTFSMFAGVVFGFIGCGLIFMGIMCVLPSTVAHTTAHRVAEPTPAKVSPVGQEAPVKAFQVLKSA